MLGHTSIARSDYKHTDQVKMVCVESEHFKIEDGDVIDDYGKRVGSLFLDHGTLMIDFDRTCPLNQYGHREIAELLKDADMRMIFLLGGRYWEKTEDRVINIKVKKKPGATE